MLKELVIKNYKGTDSKSVNLEEPILITGDNGSGKSSIIEGIIFSLQGYLPNCGRKNAEMFERSNNGKSLSFQLTSDKGTITRSLIKTRSSVAENLDATFFNENMTLKDKNILLKKIIPVNDNFADVENFLALSGPEKDSIIYKMTCSKNGIDYLKDKLNSKLPSKLAKNILERYDENLDISENIEKIYSEISTEKKIVQADLRSLENNNISEFREDGTLDNTINEKIKTLQDKYISIKSELEMAESSNQKRASLISQEKIIEAKLAMGNIKELTDERELLSKQLIEKRNFNKPDRTEELNAIVTELDKILAKGQSLNTSAKQLETIISSNTDMKNKIKELNKSKKCILDKNILCNNSANFTEALNVLNKSINEESLEFNSLNKSLDDTRALYKNARIKKEKLLKNIEKDKLDYELIKAEIQKIEAKIEAIDSKINKYKDFDIEKKSISKALKALPLNKDTSLLSKQLTYLQEQIKKHEEKREKDLKIRQNIMWQEKIHEQIEEKSQQNENLKTMERILSTIKKEIINSGIQPFVNDMNTFLTELNVPYRVFIECSKKKVLYGFEKENKISFSNLSKGESLMFMIALMAAIYKREPDTLKLLCIDNLENLDKNNLTELFKSKDILKKYFDNIIFAGVLNQYDFSEFIRIIQL